MKFSYIELPIEISLRTIKGTTDRICNYARTYPLDLIYTYKGYIYFFSLP